MKLSLLSWLMFLHTELCQPFKIASHHLRVYPGKNLFCSQIEPQEQTQSNDVKRVRRVRYSGRNPRKFEEKYKELQGDPGTVAKVIARGGTPAGQHIPILLDKCMEHLGLDVDVTSPQLVVDCTLGYGGHSKAILLNLLKRRDKSKLLCLDTDPIESKKTELRLRSVIDAQSINDQSGAQNTGLQNTLRVANINFRDLKSYLTEHSLLGKVTSLLCDLGLSSMQIDDSVRGFSYKVEGPLDMRMNPVANNETAYSLLQKITASDLSRVLWENGDEEFHEQIARSILKGGPENVPKTTTELSCRIVECLEKECGLQKGDADCKRSVTRCMQAIRIEVNQEFEVLDQLLSDLQEILAPGGKAVFLTFHSGEDRRVKKTLKAGFKAGVFSAWSRDVLRVDAKERFSNPRSKCCKLRWCIKTK